MAGYMAQKICIYEILEGYTKEHTEESILIIRKKLTKKEYKILLYGCEEDIQIQDIMDRLNLNEERYQQLIDSALWKIKVLAQSNKLKS